MDTDDPGWWDRIVKESIDEVSDEGDQVGLHGYIHSKAQRFVKIGADAYRESDALGMPHAAFEASAAAGIHLACQQVVEGRGFSEDRPIEGLDVPACHAFLATMHFRLVQQTARPGAGSLLDTLECEHQLMPTTRGRLYFLIDATIYEETAELEDVDGT